MASDLERANAVKQQGNKYVCSRAQLFRRCCVRSCATPGDANHPASPRWVYCLQILRQGQVCRRC